MTINYRKNLRSSGTARGLYYGLGLVKFPVAGRGDERCRSVGDGVEESGVGDVGWPAAGETSDEGASSVEGRERCEWCGDACSSVPCSVDGLLRNSLRGLVHLVVRRRLSH